MNFVLTIADKTMTSGLGLRWALTGPIMTNTLGGGGDFTHFMDHLGPALKLWLDDMEKHKFEFQPQQVESVKGTVNDWVSQVNLKKVEQDRDAFLGELVEKKQK